MTRHLRLDLGTSTIKAIVLERDGDSYRKVRKKVVGTHSHETPTRIVAQLGDVANTLAGEVGSAALWGAEHA